MQDPLDAYQQATTCPFCREKFKETVKLIPDCGNFICGACCDDLRLNVDGELKRYKCEACGSHHFLPDTGLPACKQLAGLLRHPIEKPLSEQARELKLLVESVQEELAKLEAFDPRDYIEQHCVQLELEVRQAAQSAVKHIGDIEAELCKQIQAYRRRCLEAWTTTVRSTSPRNQQQPSDSLASKTAKELSALGRELSEYSAKWEDYFKRLNALASDNELETAILQADAFQDRMIVLDQEMRNRALCETMMQFNPRTSFHAVRDQLGELVEISTRADQKRIKEVRILDKAPKTLTGHTKWIRQVICLPDGRLVSCSGDQTVRLWDPVKGKELRALKGFAHSVFAVALLPNGWLVAGSGDQIIRVWDLEEAKGVKTLAGHSGAILGLKVLKNGNLVSYSLDNSVKIWNPYLEKNNLLLTISGQGKPTQWSIPFGVLSNDLLVYCSHDMLSKEESTLRVWDSADGKLVKHLQTGLAEVVSSLLILSNDQIAIGTEKGTIKIVDLKRYEKARSRAKAHGQWVFCMTQLPSNDSLVSAGLDKESSNSIHSIKVWSCADLSLLQLINTGHSNNIVSLSVAEDEAFLVSGSWDKTLKLWPIICTCKGSKNSCKLS